MASESDQFHVPRQSGPRGAAAWGAQQGGWPFLPLDMALPSPAPIQQGGRRWKTPFPGWDPGHQGSTEASPALSLPGACSWAKPVMLGTTLGFQDCPSYSHRREDAALPDQSCLVGAWARPPAGRGTVWRRFGSGRWPQGQEGRA